MRFINLGMPTRRAKQACLHCRARKIRCDLAFGGSPCLNCRLDEVHCEVRGRKPKRRLDTKNARVTIKTNAGSTTTTPDNIWLQDGMFTADNNSSLGVYQFSSSNPSPCHLDNVQIESTDAGSKGELEPAENCLAFINDPDLSKLPPDDVGFLRQQGCLSVPPRPILDEFIREYFLHVHPMLPLMDESVFWENYRQQTNKLSLFLVQAMLFAACSFVSESATKELGFESPRLAAARFYQRAKLLYVFDIEPSTVDLARGALLLTFLPVSLGSDHPTPNSVWLTRAIKYAESLGASHAEYIGGADTGSLKRLWWCCILRDRSISLGQRRCVQIAGQYPLPAEDVFSSEFNGSLVYTPHTKVQLFRIFRRLVALSYTVGDLLQLMARHRNASHQLETVCADDHAILSTCREDLSTWFSATGEEFLTLGHGSQQRHPSVIVYTNFVYIQYYTAKLLLHHQKLIADVGVCDSNKSLPCALIDEVRSSTFRFIDHLSEPVRLGLARFLPISVAVYAAVPMAMHVFEARLGGQTTANQRRLRILIEMLEAHQPRFEGIEPLSLLVRQTVTSVESGLVSQRKGCLRSWTDVIAYQPYQYLNCTSVMERALCSSQELKGGSMPSSSWSAMIEYCRPELGIPSSVSDAVEGLESIHSLASLDFVMEMDGSKASLSEQELFDLCSLDWDPFSSMDIEDEEPDRSEDRVDLLDEILNDL
ncbi:n-terminal binuclear Zn cluster-containing protein [Fusarium tjaetaba]|uniref:N-terminal binuclear Zn cluster-containing protein n=1 Tax=Fusarium tjaetaba TaxID=1567544 RepID=A0A8H5SAG5_9HYPO|nr:n-terminal binuclear Zn cluster-containing protein [Fusarium tjaetaba]KAF5646956.1 n-terminal binuclear Zn cluster-containing protein [Fusarium tjaetaba]